jgi:EmrB/QacA subfamily drug resistance transporter
LRKAGECSPGTVGNAPPDEAQPEPAGAAPFRKDWWALAALCIPLIMVSIDGTILNVALPSIAKDLHTTNTQLVWINSGYIIMFGATILFSGNLADKFGRKGCLLIGMVIFIAGSIWAGLSASAVSLIGARLFQGIGGGLVAPSTLALITNIFHPPARVRAIAVWAGISGVGVALGPILGGLLLSAFFWGSVFFVNIPVVALGLIMVFLLVPNSKDENSPAIDYLGVVLSTLGLFAFFYFLIQAPTLHITNYKVRIALGLATVLLGGFVFWELHNKHPLLDVRLFTKKAFSVGVLSIAIVFFALFGMLFQLTLYLQAVQGYSPLSAGLALVPFAIVLLFAAPVAPRLAEKMGIRWLVAAGMIVLTAGLLTFLFVSTTTGYFIVFIALVLIGLGGALVQPPSSNAVMSSVPQTETGMGAAANAAIRQVGGSMGIALVGGISVLVYGNQLVKSGALQGLSSSAAATAKSSINGALAVGGSTLVKAADQAFVKGMHAGLLMTAIIGGAGIVLALLALPKQKADRSLHQPKSLVVMGPPRKQIEGAADQSD